jgi:hypothetical protein
MCRLSLNLGASTSWNPQGLSRPVMGLLYHLHTGMKLVYLGQLWLQSLFLHSPILRLNEWSSWRLDTNCESLNKLLSLSVQIEARFNCNVCFCHYTLYKAAVDVYQHCRKGAVNKLSYDTTWRGLYIGCLYVVILLGYFTVHFTLRWCLTLSIFWKSGSVLYCRFYIRKTHFQEIMTYVWTDEERRKPHLQNMKQLFLCLNFKFI